MPKKSIDYSNTVFYKIVCKNLTIKELYVGHTTDFRARKNSHKSKCKNVNNNQKVYHFIRENGDWDNWDMIIVHRQSCIDAHEARAIERQYIETLSASLNCNEPGRNLNYFEYYQLNKDKISERTKIYYIENIDAIKARALLRGDEIKEYNNSYYLKNKAEIISNNSNYNHLNKERIKETRKIYNENNIERIKDNRQSYCVKNKQLMKEKSAVYRETNKDAIKARKKLSYENNKLLKQQTLNSKLLSNIDI
jgi:hypothetical protein